MLHTILQILFVVGIVIAIIVGLLVLLCAVILLIPVRYIAIVDNSDGNQLEGHVRISWLLRVVSVKLDYDQGEFKYFIKFLGIPLTNIYNWFTQKSEKRIIRKNKKKLKKKAKIQKEKQKRELKKQKIQDRRNRINDKERKKEKKKLNLDYEKVPEKYRKYIENDNKEINLENINDKDEIDISESEKSEDDIENNEDEYSTLCSYDFDEGNDNSEQKQGFFSRLFIVFHAISKVIVTMIKLPHYIISFVSKIVELIKKIFTTTSSAIEKIGKVKDFITDKKNKSGITLVRNTISKTIKHIKPKKSNFYIRFGTGDPASTGQLLGIIAATNGLHQDFIKVVPDFNDKVIETHMYIKGRIRLFNLVVIYLKLYFDDTFKRLLKRINRLKEEIM